MVYIISVFIILAFLYIFEIKYISMLEKRNNFFSKSIKDVRKIFQNVERITFLGTYSDSSFYKLEYRNRDRRILRISSKRNIPIEFSFVNPELWYKNKPIRRYDGDIFLSIDKDKLDISRTVVDNIVGTLNPKLNMAQNEIKNKKILFDSFYEGILDMRHTNNGNAYTIDNNSDAHFIKNLFNERLS